MWGAASQRAHKRVYKHLLMLARWLTKQDNDIFLSWKLIFLWWNSMYTFSTVDVWLKYIRVHRVYSHIWPSPGRRAGYQVWWFSREGRWCCTDPSWSQVCNYGDSRRPTTRKLWSGRMTIIRIKERKKKKKLWVLYFTTAAVMGLRPGLPSWPVSWLGWSAPWSERCSASNCPAAFWLAAASPAAYRPHPPDLWL